MPAANLLHPALAGDYWLSSLSPNEREKKLQASTILLIDDDVISRSITTSALRKYGFQNLHEVESGQAALQWMEKTIPDLIILDILLPDIDGFQLCRNFRERPEWRDVPILAYTALENEQERLSILRMGASDLAFKPITPEELMARCSIHLEKRYILKDLQDYRSRMEADLTNARTMQDLLMPDREQIAQVREEYGLDIQSVFAPSSSIGGDFWGFHPFPGTGKLAIYIGDFTGHGVTAALNVFRLNALISKLPEEVLLQPAACLYQLNQQLHAMLPIELFATMFYAVLDTRSDSLIYSVAGSPPPLMLRTEKMPAYALLEGAGLPLAAIRNPQYHEHRAAFRQGDALLLYSDALIETADTKGEYLAISDIGNMLVSIPPASRSAETLLSTTLSSFLEKVGPRLTDDLTVNVYRRI